MEETALLEKKARNVAVMGVATMCLSMSGFCTCYFGFLLSIVVGIATLVVGGKVLVEARDPSSAAYAYANMGRVTGGLGLAFSIVILGLIAAYMVVYFFFIFMMFFSAAAM